MSSTVVTAGGEANTVSVTETSQTVSATDGAYTVTSSGENVTVTPSSTPTTVSATEQTVSVTAGAQAVTVSVLDTVSVTSIASIVNVKSYGALGNGVTDDQGAFTAAIAAVSAGGRIHIPAGTYVLGGGFFINKAITITGDGPASLLKMTGVTTSSALFYIGGAVSNGTPNPGYAGTIYNLGTSALSAGTTVYTFSDTTGLTVGDVLYMNLGIDPYDSGQHYLRQWNVIASIVGHSVTMRDPLPEAVSAVGAPAYAFSPSNHEAIKFTNSPDGVVLRDFAIEQSSGVFYEFPIYVIRARNINISNIHLRSVSSGIVVAESENAVIQNIQADRIWGVGFISVYGTRNLEIKNVSAGAIAGTGIYLENQMRVFSIENVSICGDEADKSTGPYVSILGGSLSGRIRNMQLIASATQTNALAMSITQGSEVQTEAIALLANATGFPLKYHSGPFRYGSTYYRDQKTYRLQITITKNMAGTSYTLPSGLLCRIKARISDKTGITVIRFSNTITSVDALNAPNGVDRFPAAGTFGELNVDYLVTLGSAAEYGFNSDPTGHTVKVWTDGTATDGAVIQLETVFLVPTDDGVNGSGGDHW